MFCSFDLFGLQVKPTLLGPVDIAGSYLRTPAVIPVKAYKLNRMTYTHRRYGNLS
jgi:hypothetical protein